MGIENQGLNRQAMSLVASKTYEGSVWSRAKKPATFFVSLESRDGSQSYAETSVAVAGDKWQRLDFTLTPRASDKTGRLVLALKQPGSVTLGYVLLQPGAWGRFQGLPVRKDVAGALVDQGLTVLRYGGSMVNSPEYRWKKMIGPRDRRPPYKGTWYPYSTNSWGIIDFLDFCSAAGFLAVPAFNMDESPQDLQDFVEYANGPADSPWGKRRVADGHPAPYRLKYLELGNEEAVNEDYWRRFKPLAEAIWASDPDIIVVVGDFLYERPIKDPYNFSGVSPSARWRPIGRSSTWPSSTAARCGSTFTSVRTLPATGRAWAACPASSRRWARSVRREVQGGDLRIQCEPSSPGPGAGQCPARSTN